MRTILATGSLIAATLMAVVPASPAMAAGVWSSVTAGGDSDDDFSCGLMIDRSLWCWGAGQRGQLGDGKTEDATLPRRVTASRSWTQVSAGYHHVCATKTNGTLWCWGRNDLGQVGDTDAPNNKSAPVQVGTDTDWARVNAGGHTTCGIKTSGKLYCWGSGAVGQMGNGSVSLDPYETPQQVGTATNWAQVAVGTSHVCGTKTVGILYCWGYGGSGELGDGQATDHMLTKPTRVETANDWATVSVGDNHSCAVKKSGSLHCWGANGDGQLGIGSTTLSAKPARVGTASDWKVATAGAMHTCGVRTSGLTYCWGFNGSGQIGNGTASSTRRKTPSRVGTSTLWTSIDAGSFHTCAVKKTHQLYCWGVNATGGLGDGTTFNRYAPKEV